MSQLSGALPALRRNDKLRPLAPDQVGAQAMHVCRIAGARGFYLQWRPGVKMPNLGRIHAMPARHLTGFEKKINQRRDGPAARIMRRIAKGFAEIATFRMRAQIEQGDDARGAHTHDGTGLHFGLLLAPCPRTLINSGVRQ
jgi:hypothetical protein